MTLPPTNPRLAQFHETLARPKLVALGDSVYAAFAYDFANFGFVETDAGIVAVDAGWFTGAMRAALADLRSHTNKPVVAIVYTHAHGDHTGGATEAAAGSSETLTVYARAGAFEALAETAYGGVPEAIIRRAQGQVGLQLPHAAQFGTAIGPMPYLGTGSEPLEPTHPIAEPTDITIGGVRLTLIPIVGDLRESLMVWLPEQRVLFTGDIVGGVFPYVQTPRAEPNRDALGMAHSLEIAAALEPRALVPGHGRVLVGTEDVADVLMANRDAILFTVHQVERYLVKGFTADQIVEEFQLPLRLAEHPDLQPHYHKIEWIVRGLVAQGLGWFHEYIDLARLNEVEETRRMIALLGGADRVASLARAALDEAEDRWAARLASMALLADPDDSIARGIRHEAFESIAATTDSSNEANWLRTAVAEESGGLGLAAVVTVRMEQLSRDQTDADLVSQFGSRLKAEEAGGEEFTVSIQVSESPDVSHSLTLRNAVLHHDDPAQREPAAREPVASLIMGRETLVALYARGLSWLDALDSNKVRIVGDEAAARRLAELLE